MLDQTAARSPPTLVRWCGWIALCALLPGFARPPLAAQDGSRPASSDAAFDLVLVPGSSADSADGTPIWWLHEEGRASWQFRLEDRPPWRQPARVSGLAEGWRTLEPASTEALDEVIGDRRVAWLRLPLRVPPEWRGARFALDIDLAGAAEIYLDGRLIGLGGRIDERGPSGEGAVRWAGSLQLFDLGPQERQEIAVRFAPQPFAAMRWGAPSRGFELVVGELSAMRARTDRLRSVIVAMQWGFAGAFGAQAFLHLALFTFYRRERSHWFFAVLACTVSILVYLQFEALLPTDPVVEARLSLWWQTFLILALLALLRFSYSLSTRCGPALFWLVTAIGLGLIVVRLVRPQVNVFVDFWWFPVLAMGASLRAMVLAMRERRRGAPILATGLLIIAAATAVQLLLTFGVLPSPFGEIAPVPYLGVLGLTLSMSVYLAKSFADTNRDLEARLVEVQELSRRNLEQELEAKEREMQTRFLAADNRRKTEELQAVREFLLSLLPRSLPDFPGYEVAAEMRTALEVGGDYYDWRVVDGALLVAIGDATGHDARAGAMVSIVKGLFTSWDGKGDPGVFLGNANATLKLMSLRSVLMSLTLLRIERDEVVVSSGGMPPPLVFRHARDEVEELTIEGMPLGALHQGPYPSRRFTLEPGDGLLLTSDGLPELQTPGDELAGDDAGMLGYEKVREALVEAARGASAASVVASMLELVDTWRQGEPPSDDVIVLAIRREEREERG
ncbi:MAG: hypothetical protein DWQ36_19510 [Acidobacteria bacterium]|nr:MAG: hypothetical protein DWQ30_06130 [Acidobacteriota bacterium]REK03729.1 MAG: hypothetical protein DWQ36_19510 [Acidobacteriota bacterium]